MVNSISSPLSFPRMGWGWKLRASNHGVVFVVTRSHPEAHLESPRENKGRSYHPGNSKGFRDCVSGTGSET